MYYYIILGFFSLTFLTTSISKIVNFSKHSEMVGIITGNIFLKKFFFWILTTFELLLSLFLFSFNNNLQVFGLILSIFLLLGYCSFLSFFIIFKKKRMGNVLCNCGGVLGNSIISWNLVIRNTVFILLILVAIISKKYTNIPLDFNIFSILTGYILSVIYFFTISMYEKMKGIIV